MSRIGTWGLRLLAVGSVSGFLDADAPAGEPRGESDILTAAADRERELLGRDENDREPIRLIEEHVRHLRWRHRVRDERLCIIGVRDDVNLLPAEFRDHRLDARPALSDARADRIHVLLGRNDGHFRSRTGFPCDGANFDRTARYLRNFHGE